MGPLLLGCPTMFLTAMAPFVSCGNHPGFGFQIRSRQSASRNCLRQRLTFCSR
ncbi:MAG: hypothetical protein Ct9H300mP1_06900 [Planctomycetaceae bacterium]|nr:MAG: hypothetical protein Ct9H300mP1_06900 [Planctomycetaceae bacterium]